MQRLTRRLIQTTLPRKHILLYRSYNTEPTVTDFKYKLRTIKIGDNKTFPADGDQVVCHYTLRLQQRGKIFDKTEPKIPFIFQLADGSTLEGFNNAVKELSLGEKAEVRIPSEQAYGEEGDPYHSIPPNADLFYEIGNKLKKYSKFNQF